MTELVVKEPSPNLELFVLHYADFKGGDTNAEQC